MGLEVFATGQATRAQWGRLRAAMCNAFDGGHASPRRLSSAFLAMERRDLALYRADARAVLRGQALPDAQDPASGTPLKPQWWARYKFAPPALPAASARVLVRVHNGVHTARFLSLSPTTGLVRVRLDGPAPVDVDVVDVDVMLVDDTLASAVASPTPTPAGLRTPPAARRVAFGQAPSPVRRSGSGPRLVVPSPRAALVTAGGGDGAVEAEVDVGQLASLIRIFEQREAAVERLKRANDSADAEIRTGEVSAATRRAAEGALSSLIDLSARTQQLFPPNGLLEAAPEPSVAQRLEYAFTAVAPPAPHSPPTTRGAPLPVLQPCVDARAVLRAPDVVRTDGMRTHSRIPVRSRAALRADFRSADGALLLGKSLSRTAMARLQNTPSFAKLRMASAAVKADIMECVAGCVALLVRARTTKDARAVDEIVQLLQHRFANMPGSVRAAAAELGSTSSESQ